MTRGRNPSRPKPDRFIVQRSGIYYYKRRVPTEVRHLDDRGEHIRISLKTDDLAKARALRDLYEAADNDLWGALVGGASKDTASRAYLAATRRAAALGFTYRPARDIAAEDIDTVLQRIEAAKPELPRTAVKALVGAVAQPTVPISQAFATYVAEISPHKIAGKSQGQKKRWEAVKRLAVDSFISVVGDLPMADITRENARAYYQHWMDRLAPRKGKPTHSPSSGNRRIGDLRVLYGAYWTHMGEPDRDNPFDKLTYDERGKRSRRRPPIPLAWITGTLLKPGALTRMNAEARGIVLVVAEIGARPSEICNLRTDAIVLDHEIPHLKIEPRDDPDDPREIKTESSVRVVPLVGLALAVMRAHPSGFPKYRDKEDAFSAAANKFCRENKLLPTPKHSIYSLRHSFEDRMKEAGIDAEMRRILMGHTIDRAEYGEGGSLALRRTAIMEVALPFDPSIV